MRTLTTKERDPKMKDKQKELVQKYSGMIYNMAKRIYDKISPDAGVDVNDLFQSGIKALLQELKKNPDVKINENSYISYIKKRAAGAMFDEVGRSHWFSKTSAIHKRKIERAIQELERELLRPVQNREVISYMDMKPNLFYQRMNEVGIVFFGENSPEEVVRNNSLETNTQETSPQCEMMIRDELIQEVKKITRSLPARKQNILYFFYELNLTQVEIGTMYGVSGSRISQEIKEALEFIGSRIKK